MHPCCLESARKYLRRGGQAATCDQCGRLLLSYQEQRYLDETRKALSEQGVEFEQATVGRLEVLAKPRASGRPKGAPPR